YPPRAVAAIGPGQGTVALASAGLRDLRGVPQPSCLGESLALRPRRRLLRGRADGAVLLQLGGTKLTLVRPATGEWTSGRGARVARGLSGGRGAGGRAEGLIAVAVEVDDVADRPAGRRTVAPTRPAQRHHRARRDGPGKSERSACEPGAPQRQGDERRAEAGGARGQEQVLDGRVDRAVQARHRDAGPRRGEGPQGRDRRDTG